ncbi:MAG: bifunctional DNA primase/polymerase [Deltaproteobacteria bacterium]|nr:MAG: bifunctional DNA primase/polymerase [Deltaproteobacteria bacterium]
MKTQRKNVALTLRKQGFSVVPANLDAKMPALRSWKQYQDNPPTEQQITNWFRDERALGVITGRVSGNTEIIDFDADPERPIVFQQWRENVEAEAPGLFEKLYIESTQNEGFHVSYRCPDIKIPGNLKLAQRKFQEDGKDQIKALIETRGEGGFCIVSPSKGYKTRQGSLADLPEITKGEREVLINAARLLNEYVEPSKLVNGPREAKPKREGVSPGDDFNERGDWDELLAKHKWTRVKRNGQYDYWRRPGKDRGHSASIIEGNIFYVFSSNAYPFESFTGYSKFAVYTLLEHGGDYSAAAKELAQQGYGDKPTPQQSTPPEEHPAWANNQTSRPPQKNQLFSLDQIADCFKQDIKWAWREHIPADMSTMFSGREGDGKTTNCIQIVKEMLEENPSDYVVWIASEGFVQDTISKMLQLKLDGSRILFLKNDNDTFSFNFNLGYDRQQLDQQLSQYKAEGKKILAVFIDSIRGITPFDDNDSRIKNVMLSLNAIVCDKHRAALIYIDHHKKGDARSALDKVVGTTAKAAAVRCVYAVTPVSGMVRKIELAKTNILDHQPAPLKSVFSINYGLIIYETEKADQTLRDDAQKWLIYLFGKRSEYRSSEIYELGEKHGYGIETLKKAKLDLGIDSKQEAVGKPWLWVCHRFLDK